MKYNYKAMDCSGREVKGVVEAKSEFDATYLIKGKGWFPISISQADNQVKEVGDYVKGKAFVNNWFYVGLILGILAGFALSQYI